MKTLSRHKPRMCPRCGYMSDATDTAFKGTQRPLHDGDFLICFGCGEVSIVHSGKPVQMTNAERAALRASLTDDERATLDQAEQARLQAVRGSPLGGYKGHKT